MTENKGLYIEEMLRKFVIPYIKKQLDSSDEIAATLSSHGITQFDSLFVPNEARRQYNNKIIDQVLAGEIAEEPNLGEIQQGIQKDMDSLGGQRFLKPSELSDKTWKEVFKDLEWEVDVQVTNEQTDKNVVLTTLTTVLQTLATNPLVLQDPNMKMLFNQILEEAGNVSPVQFSQAKAATPQVSQVPQPVGVSSAGQPQPFQQLTPQQ